MVACNVFMALTRMQRRHQSVTHVNVVCDLTFKTAAITAAMTQMLHVMTLFCDIYFYPHATEVVFSKDVFYLAPLAQYWVYELLMDAKSCIIIKLDWETVKSSFKPFRIWTVSITVSLLCTNLNSSMALFASCLTSRRVSRVLYKCGRWTRNSWQLLIAVKPFIRSNNIPLFVPWWLLFSFVAMCRVSACDVSSVEAWSQWPALVRLVTWGQVPGTLPVHCQHCHQQGQHTLPSLVISHQKV